jgi:hypothetical protein
MRTWLLPVERGGDVLVALSQSFSHGDEDIATPSQGRGGDVLVALFQSLSHGDEDIATPSG